jgi:hypothetical protein
MTKGCNTGISRSFFQTPCLASGSFALRFYGDFSLGFLLRARYVMGHSAWTLTPADLIETWIIAPVDPVRVTALAGRRFRMNCS